MKLKYINQLRNILELAEELEKQLESHSPDALLLVELTVSGSCANRALFTHKVGATIGVSELNADKGIRIFRLEGKSAALTWRHDCVFPYSQIEAAIRATAALMAAHIRGEEVLSFEHYFQREPVAV